MKNFFRKVAFGIGPEEKIPSDPLNWATSQITDKIPNFSGERDKIELYFIAGFLFHVIFECLSKAPGCPHLHVSWFSFVLPFQNILGVIPYQAEYIECLLPLF